MKTPREVLLGRHQTANARLDVLRRVALEELNHEATKKQRRPTSLVSLFLGCSQTCWRELIWPCRRTWAGLAAVWLVILAMNFAARDPLPVREARKASPVSRNLLLALREQEQLLAELTGPLPARQVENPRPTAPQPRSQRREEFLSA